MYFCEKRELNCLKRLILQRIIYIILMDSNNLTPLRKGVVGVQFLFELSVLRYSYRYW